MKNKRKNMKKIVSLILFVLIIVSSVAVFADVGGIQRYDDTTSKNNSSSGGNSNLLSFIFSPTGLIIIIIAAIFLYIWGKKKGIINNISDVTKMGDVVNQFKSELNLDGIIPKEENPIEKIKAIDPAFSEEKFLSWSKDVFVKLQNAWTNRDWTIIRPFEANSLFDTHAAQLKELTDAGKINKIEKITVQRASIKSFTEDGDKETMKVDLDAVMRDYVVDEKTNQVLEGNPNQDQYMKYTMTFIRKAGVKTQVGKSNISTTNCPNCGAPTQITSAGQCEYCGSVITTGEHDWVLSALEGRR